MVSLPTADGREEDSLFRYSSYRRPHPSLWWAGSLERAAQQGMSVVGAVGPGFTRERVDEYWAAFRVGRRRGPVGGDAAGRHDAPRRRRRHRRGGAGDRPARLGGARRPRLRDPVRPRRRDRRPRHRGHGRGGGRRRGDRAPDAARRRLAGDRARDPGRVRSRSSAPATTTSSARSSGATSATPRRLRSLELYAGRGHAGPEGRCGRGAGAPVSAPAQARPEAATLSLQEISDRLQIQDALLAYATALDVPGPALGPVVPLLHRGRRLRVPRHRRQVAGRAAGALHPERRDAALDAAPVPQHRDRARRRRGDVALGVPVRRGQQGRDAGDERAAEVGPLLRGRARAHRRGLAGEAPRRHVPLGARDRGRRLTAARQRTRADPRSCPDERRHDARRVRRGRGAAGRSGTTVAELAGPRADRSAAGRGREQPRRAE